MRLNKVSELIHASGALPNCGSAKVSVTFQDIIDTGAGPEDYEIVEGSRLTVSREAFKNNQSKYYVDGKGSNFTEVGWNVKVGRACLSDEQGSGHVARRPEAEFPWTMYNLLVRCMCW